MRPDLWFCTSACTVAQLLVTCPGHFLGILCNSRGCLCCQYACHKPCSKTTPLCTTPSAIQPLETVCVLLKPRSSAKQRVLCKKRHATGTSLELVQVDANNAQLLEQHVCCACSELPVTLEEDQQYFGPGLLAAMDSLVAQSDPSSACSSASSAWSSGSFAWSPASLAWFSASLAQCSASFAFSSASFAFSSASFACLQPLLYALHRAFVYIQQADTLPNSCELMPLHKHHRIHMSFCVL